MNFDLGSVFKTIAPMLAGTLAGPLAGLAVNAIIGAAAPGPSGEIQASQAAGGVPGAIAKIQELFTQGALQAGEIKKAEIAHSERMAELGFKNVADLAKIDADDRASARAREMAVRDSTPAILAYCISAGFFGVLGYILYAGVPALGGEALLVLLGSLGTAWTGIVAYYFGSSASSKSKDSTIAEIAKSP